MRNPMRFEDKIISATFSSVSPFADSCPSLPAPNKTSHTYNNVSVDLGFKNTCDALNGGTSGNA